MNRSVHLPRTLWMLLLAVLCLQSARADSVSPQQAMALAQDFLQARAQTSGGPAKANSQRPQLTPEGEVSGLYVFNVPDQGGFVIVSGDDRTRPVLGFASSGNIDTARMPENMRAWLQGYADEIAWLQQHDSPQSTPKGSRRNVGSHSTEAIAPMCTARWNQDSPYNNLCPTVSSWSSGSSRCATGCVATAMAQVMYYHKWPQSATKAVPAYTTESYSISLATLPATTFDWTNMRDSYTGSYTTAQANAVAKLMQYCGHSVQMDYGPSSGAYTEDVATALREYFDYNAQTTKFISRSSYTYADWTDLIYHELRQGRPVVYGGLSTGGGHEFVCDGYKFESGTDFFHINWGWGGLSDNYFVLSALDPDQQGIGGSSSTDGFHYAQDAVVGIQRSTDHGTLADIAPSAYNLILYSIHLSHDAVPPSTTVEITFNITNDGSGAYDGDIWLCLQEGENSYLTETIAAFIDAGATQECTISYTPTEVGTYTLQFAYVNGDGEYVADESQSATLLVAEGLTNGIVPVYGYWADAHSRSQFVIAEAQLEDMVNADIDGVTFYATERNVSWGSAEFDVYLCETDRSSLSSLQSWSTMQKVFSGSLSVVDGEMAISFSEPFHYSGGNLMVGVNQTATGSYAKSTWLGQTMAGVSVGGYDSSVSQQNFLPRTSFSFTPGTTPHARVPKDLSVSYSGGTEAVVSWTGTEPSFDIDVNGTVTEGVVSPTTLEGLELATLYIIKVRARNGDAVSDWTEPVSFITDLSAETCQLRLELSDVMGDGWNGAAIRIVDVLTATELGTYACTEEVGMGQAETYYAEVPDGRDIEFQWVKGTYDQECVYTVFDVRGDTIFSGKKRLQAPVVHHVACADPKPELVLHDDSDNAAAIDALHGTTLCTVTLQGRTLPKDGTWSTICLPFDLQIEGSPLDGADARAMNGARQVGQTIILNFTEEGTVTHLVAGTPYIVRWTEGTDLESPVFQGVSIDGTLRHTVCQLDEERAVCFTSTYDVRSLADADGSILLVGTAAMFAIPTADAAIGPARAFLKLQGLTATADNLHCFRFCFGNDDPTGLTPGQDSADAEEVWFDLSGRRIANGKTASRRPSPGLYISRNKVIAR